MRAFTLLIGLLALLGSIPSLAQRGQQAVELDALLAAFAKMEGLEARFTEEKRMKLLKAPLTSSGRLYFTRPGYLLKSTEAPQPSRVLISPTSLTMQEGSTQERIDLRVREDVRSVVIPFVALLAGDKVTLTQAYRVELVERPGPDWRMELRPRKAPLSQVLEKIWVTGRGPSVAEIHVFDTSGDETITRLRDVDPKRRFAESERKTLFGIGAP